MSSPAAPRLAVVLALALTAFALVPALDAEARVPPGPAVYRARLTGTTYAFNGIAGKYLPVENFRRRGRLFVDPHPGGGRRRRSIGLFVGHPAVVSRAGLLQFATNSRAFRHTQYIHPARAALEFAPTRVRGNRSTSTVRRGTARRLTAELFDWRTSVLGAPIQILAGRMSLRFRRSGRRVRGRIDLAGNPLIEPGNTFPVYAYAALISARRLR
jgi:hypothetical protein